MNAQDSWKAPDMAAKKNISNPTMPPIAILPKSFKPFVYT